MFESYDLIDWTELINDGTNVGWMVLLCSYGLKVFYGYSIFLTVDYCYDYKYGIFCPSSLFMFLGEFIQLLLPFLFKADLFTSKKETNGFLIYNNCLN